MPGAFAERLVRRLEQLPQLFYRDADWSSGRFRERPLQARLIAYTPAPSPPHSVAALCTALPGLIQQEDA